jgi:serine/threonine protein kinase
MQHYCEHCRKFVEARRAQFSSSLICSICGSEFGADFLAAGTIVSGFRIEEEIGRGSFGVVYKALQLNLERMVALKVLSDELSRDSNFVDNFFREARLAASLSHPNIVQAFDAGATPEGIYYFAMELIEGETLESRISRVGRMECTEAVPVALKIARALDYAWERQKLTHGDIKPENIILNSSGEAKLADLGLAKTAHEERTGHLMVTPLYAPPEVVSGVDNFDSVKADIYSFGGTFYHMLAGAPPFNEDDPDRVMEMHLNQIPESLGARFKINSDVSFITDRMLAKNPDERPQSWHEIVEFLDAIDLELPVMSKSTRRTPIMIKPAKVFASPKKLVYLLGGLVVLILLLGSLVWSLSGSGKTAHSAQNGTNGKNGGKDYEWNKLKTDIKFLSEGKALELVSEYIGGKKGDIPEDALKTLSTLKKEHEKAEQRKQLTHEFDTELTVLKKELSDDLTLVPPSRLASLQNRVVHVFKELSEHKFLQNRVSQEDKSFFDEKIKKLNEAILNNRSQAGLLQAAGLDQQRINDLNERKEQDRVLSVANDEIDRFVSAVADFSSYNGEQRDMKAFSLCFLDISVKDLPEAHNRLFNFIREVYRRQETSMNLLIGNKELFYGTVPFKGGSYGGYEIASIDNNTITFKKDLDYGTRRKPLPLAGLSEKNRFTLAYSVLGRKDVIIKLNPDSCILILRGLLNYGRYKEFDEFLNDAYQFSEEQKQLWRELKTALQNFSVDSVAIKLWKQTVSAVEAGNYLEAMRTLREIRSSYPESDFVRRRKEELSQTERMLSRISPLIQAAQSLEYFKKMERDGNPGMAFQTAIVNWGRYGQLKELPHNVAGELISARNKVLSWLGIEKFSQQKLPFFMWEHCPIGSLRACEKDFFANFPAADLQQSFKLAAGMDAGLWDHLEEYSLNIKEPGKLPDAYRQAGLERLAVTVAFSYGLVALRYGNRALLETMKTELARMAETGDASVKTVYAEFLLQLRRGNELKKLIDSFDFNADASPEAFRLGLCDLYNVLQDPQIDIINFSRKVKSYRLIYGENSSLLCDLRWVQVADSIINDKFNYTDIETLKRNKCFNADICSRIVLDAALAAFSRRALPPDALKEIIKLCDLNISGNTASSSLWQKKIITELALCENMKQLELTMDKIVNDRRVASYTFYPEWVMLRVGLENVIRDVPSERLPKIYGDFINYSPIFSEAEKDAMSRINNDPAGHITALFEAERYSSAYWNAIFGMLLHFYNNAESVKIRAVLDKYANSLSREEKLFLDRLYRNMLR